jgi:hypothetical protein
MKIQTLFKAYKIVERNKRHAEELRGRVFGNGRFGIAAADDQWAKYWQRQNRQSIRIEARIMGEKVCPICVAPNGNHFSKCRYYKVAG